MAQTKKKRRSKHRGNAAGVVEARGRTGRKPTETERKASAKELAADRRRERLMRPPSWKSATYRSAAAALLLGVLAVTILGQTVPQAISLTLFVFVLYIPLSYYTDALIFRRRTRNEARAKT